MREEAVREDAARSARPPCPRRRSHRGVRPRRLERGVGHHLGGDPERAGMEARVERAGQALSPSTRPGTWTGAGLRRVATRVNEADVGLELRVDQVDRAACVRLLHRLDVRGVPHRVAHRRHRSARPRAWSVSATFSVTASAAAWLRRPVLVPDHGGVARHPLDPAHELGQRDGSRRGAGRRIGRPRELPAEAISCGDDDGRVRRPDPSVPRAGASARRATADRAADSRRRRLSCQGGGQTSMAGRDARRPRRASNPPGGARWPMPAGPRHRQDERQQRRRRRRRPGAPRSRRRGPRRRRRAMVTTAATSWVETAVPSTVKQTPTTKSPPKETRRVRGRPEKSTKSSSAKDPKAPNRATCGSAKTAWVMAKTDGHHDGGPHRALRPPGDRDPWRVQRRTRPG